jgi:hypothetical protein
MVWELIVAAYDDESDVQGFAGESGGGVVKGSCEARWELVSVED